MYCVCLGIQSPIPAVPFQLHRGLISVTSIKVPVGNTAILWHATLACSFETSGWCQSLRGPRGGGLVDGLAGGHLSGARQSDQGSTSFQTTESSTAGGDLHSGPPASWSFAESGFIPLIYRKETAEAASCSTQSIGLVQRFKIATTPRTPVW